MRESRRGEALGSESVEGEMEEAADSAAAPRTRPPGLQGLLARPWAMLVLAVALALGALAAHSVAVSASVVSRTIPAKAWGHINGHLYYAAIPELHGEADSNDGAQRSQYRMYEDGRPFGAPHSAHQSVIDTGGGLYSHWLDGVYLSTPDNSDPGANGHVYTLRKTSAVNDTLTIVLGAASALAVLLAVWRGALSGAQQVRRRLSLMTFLTLANLVVALTLVWFVAGVERRTTLNTEGAGHTDGFMYFANLPDRKGDADTNNEPVRSPLRLYENGIEMGPAHCSHATIIAKGLGCYSHWDTGVALSALDNSDVRTNGRIYEAVERVPPPWWLLLGVGVLWLAVFAATVRDRAAAGRNRSQAAFAALKDSGFPALAAIAIIAPPASLLVAAAGATPTASSLAGQLRTFEEWAVGGVFAVAAAIILAWRGPRSAAAWTARLVAGALLVLMVLYGILDLNYGLANQTPLMAEIFLAALALALVLRFAAPRLRAAADQQIDALLPSTRVHLWILFVTCCALTVIQVIPEVLQYWDQSGWMDSDGYDRMGHFIATGQYLAGDGTYPPVYQYGLAALYWTFGHFFFVQQIANLLLALVTTACLCGAAWFLFRSFFATWLAGLFAAHWETMHHATWYTQIEGWYVPVFAASLLALAVYLKRPTIRAALLLGAAAGLVLATRQQGLFYAMALAGAALFVAGLSLRQRIAHVAVFAALFVSIGVVPWSMRNYAVEGRFSPSSAQSNEFLAYLNDPRIPLYGIRYWENFQTVVDEWLARYPDVAKRRAAMTAFFIDRLTHHPDYFIAALPWRAAAFYGLIPTEVITGSATMAQVWANPAPQVESLFRFWAPLLASIVGFGFAIRTRQGLLLGLLVPANVLVGLLVGSAEPRLCYPVLGLNLLLALAAIAPLAPQEPAAGQRAMRFGTGWAPALLAAGFGILVAHIVIGRPNMYRDIKTASYAFASPVVIDRSLPEVVFNLSGTRVDGALVDSLEPGKRYRTRLKLSNSQFPPRYTIDVQGVDVNLRKPETVEYFQTTLATNGGLALRYSNVTTAQPLREGMTIDAEIVVDSVSLVYDGTPKTNWSRLDKAVVVGEDR